MEAATRMIQELCGGEASELVVTGKAPEWKRSYTLRPGRIHALGGVDVPADRAVGILTDLGFEVARKDSALSVSPPPRRGDVQGEADLVEEVIRIHGYDKNPALPLQRENAMPTVALTPAQRRSRDARRALAGFGLTEAVTFSFLSRAHAALFGGDNPALLLANPISADLDMMRPSLLPNLLLAAKRNADRGVGDSMLFEVGPQFGDDTPTGQRQVAAGLRVGASGPRNWGAKPRPVDALDAKGDALALLSSLGLSIENVQVAAEAPPWYHPGRSGALKLGPKTVLATFGELHPRVLAALDVKSPAVAFELFLDALPAPKAKDSKARPLLRLSAFQPVERDFAFLLDANISADQVIRAARRLTRLSFPPSACSTSIRARVYPRARSRWRSRFGCSPPRAP
jgi:phenylalanyl-tRNA synthetase beta chain